MLKKGRRKVDRARRGIQPAEATYVKKKTKNKIVAVKKVPGVT